MFWVVMVDGELETIATETVGDDVRAVDTAADEIVAAIASFREEPSSR